MRRKRQAAAAAHTPQRRTFLQGGRLHSAFLQTSRNGYLAFQSKPEREAGKFAVILVYMEGDISEKQLRELFSNQ